MNVVACFTCWILRFMDRRSLWPSLQIDVGNAVGQKCTYSSSFVVVVVVVHAHLAPNKSLLQYMFLVATCLSYCFWSILTGRWLPKRSVRLGETITTSPSVCCSVVGVRYTLCLLLREKTRRQATGAWLCMFILSATASFHCEPRFTLRDGAPPTQKSRSPRLRS